MTLRSAYDSEAIGHRRQVTLYAKRNLCFELELSGKDWMKSVHALRTALSRIEGALVDQEPSQGPSGAGRAQDVHSIWSPEAAGELDWPFSSGQASDGKGACVVTDFEPVFSIAPQFEDAFSALVESSTRQ